MLLVDRLLEDQVFVNSGTLDVGAGVSQFTVLVDVKAKNKLSGNETLTFELQGLEGTDKNKPINATASLNDVANDNCGSGCSDENLISNGDFEQVKDLGGNYWQPEEIEGWTVENKDGEIWRSSFQGINDSKGGSFFAELDAKREFNSLSQIISTEKGATYTLSFDLHRRNIDKIETVVVSIDDFAVNSPTANQWVNHTYSFAAKSDSTKISFSELEEENDSYGGLIDNVSVVKNCDDSFKPKFVEDLRKVDGAEIDPQNNNDVNKSKNPYLTYIIDFDDALEQIQTLPFEFAFGKSQANIDDVLLDEISFYRMATKIQG